MSPRRVVRWLGARIVHPVDIAAVLKWAAAVVLGLAVIGATVTVLVDRANVRDQLDAADERDACQSGLGTAVQDAQTDYLIDIGDLVVSLAHDEELDPFVDDLERSGDALDAARDARVAYEESPTRACEP